MFTKILLLTTSIITLTSVSIAADQKAANCPIPSAMARDIQDLKKSMNRVLAAVKGHDITAPAPRNSKAKPQDDEITPNLTAGARKIQSQGKQRQYSDDEITPNLTAGAKKIQGQGNQRQYSDDEITPNLTAGVKAKQTTPAPAQSNSGITKNTLADARKNLRSVRTNEGKPEQPAPGQVKTPQARSAPPGGPAKNIGAQPTKETGITKNTLADARKNLRSVKTNEGKPEQQAPGQVKTPQARSAPPGGPAKNIGAQPTKETGITKNTLADARKNLRSVKTNEGKPEQQAPGQVKTPQARSAPPGGPAKNIGAQPVKETGITPKTLADARANLKPVNKDQANAPQRPSIPAPPKPPAKAINQSEAAQEGQNRPRRIAIGQQRAPVKPDSTTAATQKDLLTTEGKKKISNS